MLGTPLPVVSIPYQLPPPRNMLPALESVYAVSPLDIVCDVKYIFVLTDDSQASESAVSPGAIASVLLYWNTDDVGVGVGVGVLVGVLVGVTLGVGVGVTFALAQAVQSE